MPTVEVSTYVEGPLERAYALARDMESFPRFMKDLISVTTLERDADGSTLTEWVARLQGKVLRWKERDAFDDAAHVIRFHQTEGDLKRFEGEWRFIPEGTGTRIALRVEFDLGIPMFRGLLDPVARLVLKNNCESMLAAIKGQVEAGA